jgi:hypothetical protein
MAANEHLSNHGLELFYGDLNTDPATQIVGLQAITEFPSAEVAEFMTTRLDQKVGEEVDWVEKPTPGRINPGQFVFNVAMAGSNEEDCNSLLRQEKRFKLRHHTGNELLVDGWFKKVQRQQGDGQGEMILQVTLRCTSLPEIQED